MNIADVKVGHVGLEERERGMKRDREQECARERDRVREALWRFDLNPALQCCVSLLLDKVIRHQEVLFLYLFCPQSGFKVINHEVTPTFVVKSLTQH